MIANAPPLLFRFRETVATMPSVLALVALALLGVQQTVKLVRHTDETPVQISLMSPEPPQEIPKPVQPPEPPKPKVVQPPPPVPKPVQQPAAKPVVNAPAPSTPTATTTPELPATAPRAAEPAPQQPTPAPAPVAAPAPARPVAANVEAEYVGKLRAHLNSIKRYPTGREASQMRPQGKVRLWFVLKRDGSVVDVGIDASSNSMLLDDAARKTITRASFSAFPENTWAGENTHRFTAELEFIPGG
ncbi:TonB family protein [Herbaspirillum sp. CF444]|uniref:energy transducer TonB n=1 Tax=Herbaspirillum sp. CF444 TaxID=1144319 RepID=UPI0002727EB2|nr:energy transducer TonB [Herbaspirillum sp. CF444]EJL87510.1 TonB family protein [Herbaspirillum sp. CF444]